MREKLVGLKARIEKHLQEGSEILEMVDDLLGIAPIKTLNELALRNAIDNIARVHGYTYSDIVCRERGIDKLQDLRKAIILRLFELNIETSLMSSVMERGKHALDATKYRAEAMIDYDHRIGRMYKTAKRILKK